MKTLTNGFNGWVKFYVIYYKFATFKLYVDGNVKILFFMKYTCTKPLIVSTIFKSISENQSVQLATNMYQGLISTKTEF